MQASPSASQSRTSTSKRIPTPPALSLAEAEHVGIVRPRSLRVPGCSVLKSSGLRRRGRLCVHGPGVRGAQRREDESTRSPRTSPSPERRTTGPSEASKPNLRQIPKAKSGSQQPPKTPEVSSVRVLAQSFSSEFLAVLRKAEDYRLPTQSWMARLGRKQLFQPLKRIKHHLESWIPHTKHHTVE